MCLLETKGSSCKESQPNDGDGVRDHVFIGTKGSICKESQLNNGDGVTGLSFQRNKCRNPICMARG